jgi:hypothetical protein
MGWAILIPVLAVLMVLLGLDSFSVGSRRTILVPVAALLVVVAPLFATLTVTVNDGWLEMT